MKTYILQKDLPDVKAGAELKLSDNAGTIYRLVDKHPFNDMYAFPRDYVEKDDGKWFKLKEEEIPMGLAVDLSNGSPKELQELLRLWRQFKPTVLDGDKKYTKEDLRKCFNSYEEMHQVYPGRIKYRFESFDEYFNSLNEIK